MRFQKAQAKREITEEHTLMFQGGNCLTCFGYSRPCGHCKKKLQIWLEIHLALALRLQI